MRKSIVVMALMSVFALYSCKDNAADKVNEENVAATAEKDAESGKFPVMTFAEEEYDFGTIERGTRVEHTFKFTNTGDAPLTIVNARSSCGCTVPDWTRTPIAPGEQGELLVKFDGSGQNQVTKTVTITANTEKGTEHVRIKAFVSPQNATSSVN